MREEKKPFVSVIIPTYHDWERLQLCLDALEKQTYPKENFEIIVVNNDPDDQPPIGLAFPDNCQLIEESKPGSYAARNAALDVAKGDIYAFTDSDCQPQLDWLEKAESLFSIQPEVSRIGGKISLIINDARPSLSELYEKAYAFRQQDFVRDKGMAATGNMIAKKSVFDSIGVFNDRLMSGGDAEWGMRAQSKGYKIVFLEDCVVWHPTRRKLEEIVQKTKREAGGHFSLIKNKSLFKKVFSITIGFLPPLKSMVRVVLDKELTSKEKIIAILIRYYLRIVSSMEKFRLLSGIKDMERV